MPKQHLQAFPWSFCYFAFAAAQVSLAATQGTHKRAMHQPDNCPVDALRACAFIFLPYL